jgi:hypothetical protein
MPESPAFLAERLKTEGEKTVAFFDSLADEKWNSVVYSEGAEWTIRSILAHFVTAERAFIRLFENIREGGPGASEDFSIDRYNAHQQEKTKDIPPHELLAQFVSVRAELAAWVATLDDRDLVKRGRHPFLGIVSLAEMIKMVYRHNQIHYRDIRKMATPE